MKVTTYYLPATDTRGERIRVTAHTESGPRTQTVSWDYSQNDMHEAAVRAMLGNVTIRYIGDRAHGKTYDVTPSIVEVTR